MEYVSYTDGKIPSVKLLNLVVRRSKPFGPKLLPLGHHLDGLPLILLNYTVAVFFFFFFFYKEERIN
jgi:hypothetical protein